MEIPSLVLCISFMFSTLIFLKIATMLKTQKPSANFPPGPWKLPLIGNMHHLAGAVPHRSLHRLAQKFGPMMGLQLGEISAVVISSADAAKQIMKTHDINFASRPPILAAEIIGYGCTSISFSPYGDYWRQLRKICTVELLSAKRVQSFRPLRERVFVDLCRRFAGHSVEGSAINFSEEFSSATYALTVKAAIGVEKKQHQALFTNLTRIAELSAGFDVAEVFPSARLLKLVSGLRKKIMVVHKNIDGILEDVIHQHKTSVKKEEHEDLLDVLLKYQKDGLTNDNIKSVLVDMLAGGTETSATTMEWTMSELLKNPRILKKAQEEVRLFFDKEGTVDESRIRELKYLKSVVKEVLRMHPPVPLLLPRKCMETCEINGYEIPAETKIIINAWSVNRDPKYWENGTCFKPERFLDSPVDFKGNDFEYIPFGAGRRMCPGMTYGLASVELPLALFLYHFDWKLGGEMKPQDLDMEESFGIASARLKNLFLVAAIKRPLPNE